MYNLVKKKSAHQSSQVASRLIEEENTTVSLERNYCPSSTPQIHGQLVLLCYNKNEIVTQEQMRCKLVFAYNRVLHD